jgi:hypothetical protein
MFLYEIVPREFYAIEKGGRENRIRNQEKKWIKFRRENSANTLRKNRKRNNKGEIDQKIE